MAKKSSTPSTGSAFYRCKVEASVVCVEHEYSRSFGPGAVVDMAEEIAPGLALGDCVNPEWFEPVSGGGGAPKDEEEGA